MVIGLIEELMITEDEHKELLQEVNNDAILYHLRFVIICKYVTNHM